eukprot:gene10642-477_t
MRAMLPLFVLPARSAPPPRVTTTGGVVEGLSLSVNDIWQSIPYAEPPVGKLRWAPPVPKAAWVGVLNATPQTPSCPSGPGGGREDCLYLEVTAPKNATGLPVLVHIHGGAFHGGTVS